MLRFLYFGWLGAEVKSHFKGPFLGEVTAVNLHEELNLYIYR